jgi:hypothetical protein
MSDDSDYWVIIRRFLQRCQHYRYWGGSGWCNNRQRSNRGLPQLAPKSEVQHRWRRSKTWFFFTQLLLLLIGSVVEATSLEIKSMETACARIVSGLGFRSTTLGSTSRTTLAENKRSTCWPPRKSSNSKFLKLRGTFVIMFRRFCYYHSSTLASWAGGTQLAESLGN